MLTLSSMTFLALAASSLSAPTGTSFQQTNALQAQQLNTQFATLKISDSCTDGQQACVQGSFAQCVGTKWEVTPCAAGTICVALPLVNKAGTSLACDTQADALARMQAAGVDASLTGNDNSTSTSTPTESSGSATDASVPCPMMTSSAVAASSVSTTPTATSAASPAGSDDSDCADEDYAVEFAIAPAITSPASTATAVGFTRPNIHFYVDSVNDSATSVDTVVTSTAIVGSSSVADSASPSVTPSSNPVDDGITTVTVLTTLFLTVTPPSSPIQATSAPLASGAASVASTAVASSAVPASVDSSTVVSATTFAPFPTFPLAPSSQSTIITFVSTTPVAAVTASAGTAAPTFIALSRPAAVASPASSPVSSSSAVTTTSSSTITSVPSSAPAETSLNSADIAFMLTATVGQEYRREMHA